MKLMWVAIVTACLASSALAVNEKGKDIYNKACVACHSATAAAILKSPPAHDETAWKARTEKALDAAKTSNGQFKTAEDVLVHHVKTGYNAMPAGGTCIDATTPDQKCSDDDYKSAIDYMSHKE